MVQSLPHEHQGPPFFCSSLSPATVFFQLYPLAILNFFHSFEHSVLLLASRILHIVFPPSHILPPGYYYTQVSMPPSLPRLDPHSIGYLNISSYLCCCFCCWIVYIFWKGLGLHLLYPRTYLSALSIVNSSKVTREFTVLSSLDRKTNN